MNGKLALLALGVAASAGVVASPADEAIKRYVDCLETTFAEAEAAGQLRADAETTAFDGCQAARDAIAKSLDAETAERIIGQIDTAARAGIDKLP